MSLRPGDDIDVSKHHWIERPSDRSVKGKVEALRTEPYDLIFIHRDSDAMGWESRAKEILGCCDERVRLIHSIHRKYCDLRRYQRRLAL